MRLAGQEVLRPEADEGVRRLDDVHGGRSQEAGDERIGRLVVDLRRRSDLPDLPTLHHGDAVAKAHGLDLVVGDIERGDPDPPLELLQLIPGGGPKLGVEVRERLVEQKHRGLTDDRPGQRDSLPLAARELPGLSLEELLDPEEGGGPLDLLGDGRLRHPLGLEREGDVLVDAHVGVEGVALKDHRDLPGARGKLVDDTAADQDLPSGRALEAGDHPEERRLAAARRTEQNEELALLGGEVHAVHRPDLTEILPQRLRLYRGQIRPAPSPSICRRCASRPRRPPGARPRGSPCRWPLSRT